MHPKNIKKPRKLYSYIHMIMYVRIIIKNPEFEGE